MHSVFLFLSVLAALGPAVARPAPANPKQFSTPTVSSLPSTPTTGTWATGSTGTSLPVSSSTATASVSKKATVAVSSQQKSATSSAQITSVSSQASKKSSTSTQSTTTSALPSPSPGQCGYWMEHIAHQGIAAFNSNPSTYQVFRNVKDFGAKGDGVHDDTAAIQLAIASGNRCAPGKCASSTTTPAVVYFPQGTYVISSSIVDYYYTQLIGNPNCLPVIQASSKFNISSDPYLIDGDPYSGAGNLEFGATNVFWRQIRNFVIDMTQLPPAQKSTGIHWPTGQATSITNVVFQMSEAANTMQQGILIENGSGGWLNDLVFNGGHYGGNFGNQQFSMRNLTFNNCQTAIFQSYSWGWVYQGITINNASVGLNMYNGGPTAGGVGSITFIDSVINNTPVGIYTAHTTNSTPITAGSLILENVQLNNVPVAVKGGDNQTALAGTHGTTTISGWGEGHSYTPNGPKNFEGSITPVSRPVNLIEPNGNYYTQSKPQYQNVPVSGFLSARTLGATGNGKTDDTAALQSAINESVAQNKILYVDQGDYLVTSTIYVPAGARIVGESYSVILSSGNFFNSFKNPQPVVQIGKPGEQGSVQWSDMIVSTQGQQRGAILIQYNLVAPTGSPTGVWDVHTRIGGFAGSDLQLADCPTTPNTTVTMNNLNKQCIAGFLHVHITEDSAGLYMENNWFWTADHDVEDPNLTQITIYNGRGMLVESTNGPTWLWGSAVEHNTKYQYTFADAANVFAGFIQTETPYYQPNPTAAIPFPFNSTYKDPQFNKPVLQTNGLKIPNADAWGLRLLDAQDVNIYGAGHYSFFNNYSTDCVAYGGKETCQSHIVQISGDSTSSTIYNLNTVGSHYMFTNQNQNEGLYSDNADGFVQSIALIRDAGAGGGGLLGGGILNSN